MESYILWREIVDEVSKEYPDVELKHLYADNCAYQMIKKPNNFDVILSCNFLGDLLSDLYGVISGSLGMLPSACLSSFNKPNEANFGIAKTLNNGFLTDDLGGSLSTKKMTEKICENINQ